MKWHGRLLQILLLIVGLIAMITIFYGTLLPGTGRPFGWYHPVRLHFFSFFALSLLFCVAIRPRGAGLVLLAVTVCLVGVVAEVGQNWVPARTAQLEDALLNILGGLSGCAIWGLLWMFWQRLVRGRDE
jgi:hypothetical protein